MSFAPLHFSCGHTEQAPIIGGSHDTPHRDTPCFACSQQDRAEKVRAARASGPLATHRQITFLLDLAERSANLPAGCPTTREAAALLPRNEVSQWIDTLKATARPAYSTARSRRCECASGRYGGVCTCD